ncbi:btb/poz domain-containing protein [Moumouvirus maliensis]|nr:btb/poz domain-containing protein [Moumouvirus maliensis]
MDVTIIAGNDYFQTKYETIKNVPGFVNNLTDNNIITRIPTEYIKNILNYLRGYEITESPDIYYYMNLLGIEIQKENHVKINIGGRIFYLDKNFLTSKFEYFEKLFKYHNDLDPDYSSIVIDRCYDLFKKVIDHTQNEKEVYFEFIPKINISLQNELNFYGKKPVKVVKKFINLNYFRIIKKPSDNFYYVNYKINFSQYLSSDDNYNIYNIPNEFLYNGSRKYNDGFKTVKIIFELETKIKKNEISNYFKIPSNVLDKFYYDKQNNLFLLELNYNESIIPILKIQVNKIISIKKSHYLVKYFINDYMYINEKYVGRIYPVLFKLPIKFGSENKPINMLIIKSSDLINPQFFNIKKNNHSIETLSGILKINHLILDLCLICKNVEIEFVEIKIGDKIILRSSVSKIIKESKIYYNISDLFNKKLNLFLHLGCGNWGREILIYFKKPSYGKLTVKTFLQAFEPKLNS